MDSNTIIILLIYYIGIASCAAQGAEKGKAKNNIPIQHYIGNAFGGGFIRDVIFLGIHPWLFTLSALPDILLVIFIGCLYTHCICNENKKQHGTVLRLVSITDAFGLCSFICIGMDKAFIYNRNAFTTIACGYITAVGGGIITSGESLMKIFNNRKMVYYHVVTLLGCYYYYIFRHSLCLICFIVSGLFLINIDYRILYNLDSNMVIAPNLKVFLLCSAINKQNSNYKKQRIIKNNKKLDIRPLYPKIYLVQQRIRQC